MKKHNYLTGSLWYREVIHDPYRVIAQFFDAADMVSHRQCIIDTLHAACTNDIWSKKNPGDLLVRFKLIESIVNSAHLINKKKKKSPLTIDIGNAFDPRFYSSRLRGLTAWDFLPRMLLFEEYCDPYLVFKRFFKFLPLSEWRQDLQDLVDFALIEMSLSDAGINFETLPRYVHLIKLVEAAHLINVREIARP